MTVRSLDHVNICTPDVAATARFFAEVLGMTATESPGSADPTQARWIRDDQDRPIIHLVSPELMGQRLGDGVAADGSGRIHHVALACDDFPGVVARLDAQGIGYRSFEASERRVLFVPDPNGIVLELNFPA